MNKMLIHRLVAIPIAVAYALCMLVACTTPSYPSGIDRPATITELDREVIAYIDKRLSEEYYWLDEVQERSGSFNRNMEWSKYLNSTLNVLTTNVDDGYRNNKGARLFYSYIRNVDADTRSGSMVSGFGIDLHYTVAKLSDDTFGFIISNVYPDSPAAQSDIRRGDVIISIDGRSITQGNYQTLFNTIQLNTASTVQLSLMRQYAASEQERSLSAKLQRGSYFATPIAYCDLLDIEGVDERIGYLVYNSFESNYNDELEAALAGLKAEGVEELILDLRCNSGGSVSSAVLLCSSIWGSAHEGELLFELRRNPKNISNNKTTQCLVEANTASLDLERLTVICSNYSASASEMVITGMRGVDIPVTLIGCTTEGKNCGMDVTRRSIGSLYLEYAPITFMCYNAEGFGEYGEGIVPDVDLCKENKYGVSDEHYPIPRCEWGNVNNDIALAVAVASVAGKQVSQEAKTRTDECAIVEHSSIAMPRPLIGARLEENEQ